MANSDILRRWQDGLPLSEAWLLFGSPNLPEKSRKTRKIAPGQFSSKTGMGMFLARLDNAQRESLMSGFNALQNFKNDIREQIELENQLKNDFLKKLQKRELLAFGYSLDAPSDRVPTEIPQRFFDGRYFKWNLDIVSDPPVEYRQVRIVRVDINPSSTVIPTSNKRGRPSDQAIIFTALKTLVETDPGFRKKHRKVQSSELQEFIKSKSDRAPSVRTISKSIPIALARLKLGPAD